MKSASSSRRWAHRRAVCSKRPLLHFFFKFAPLLPRGLEFAQPAAHFFGQRGIAA
jgi:hypothetical protein